MKEEVVESCMIDETGAVVEMTLPSLSSSLPANIITSLPQVRNSRESQSSVFSK